MESGIFTKEYQSGTLVLSFTKGLARYKAVISKTIVLNAAWTVGYWLCFGITYGYNAYFWDNSAAHNLIFSGLCWWLFGIWVIALVILFSTMFGTNTGVLIATGSVVFASYLLGLVPQLKEYLPSFLTDTNSIIYGMKETETYIYAFIISITASIICFTVSIPIMNKRSLN